MCGDASARQRKPVDERTRLPIPLRRLSGAVPAWAFATGRGARARDGGLWQRARPHPRLHIGSGWAIDSGAGVNREWLVGKLDWFIGGLC